MSRPQRGVHPVTLFTGGPILTMDGPQPVYADAVVITDGRIAYVGDLAGARDGFPDAATHDLDGATLLPGFIDAHSHLLFGFDLATQANVGAPPVGTSRTIPEVIAVLEAFRDDRAVAVGDWIVGWGYDHEALTEARHITRHDLDAAFPEHPVQLIHVSGHGAVFNSVALERLGITAATETPPGGVIARDDGSNEPAGLLLETAFLLVRDRLPHASIDDRFDLLDSVQQLYASQGYTHAQEGFSSAADLQFFREAAARGLLYLDVLALGSFLEANEWVGKYSLHDYVDGFAVGGMKIVGDGSPQAKTAYVTEPYRTGGPDGSPTWRGQPTMPAAQLAAVVASAVQAGVPVFVHANGDAAIDDVIAAVRATGTTASDDRRTVIIHSQFQRPDHLDAYLELGISPSYFTNHTLFWGDVHVANIGPDKASFISPMHTAAQRGLIVSNHSDFTVTPLDPFLIMSTAMNRTTRSGRVLGPGERATPYLALQALTSGPAYQAFAENRVGRLREGLLADLVIVSGDPLVVGAAGIRDLVVIETIKEGVTVYRVD